MKKLIAVMFAAGAVSSTAIAGDEYWQGASGDDWSASRWNGSSQFAGGNAIFSSPSSLTVSDNITATKITADADTTISKSSNATDGWSKSYNRFRFCVGAPRNSFGSGGTVSLSEIELLDASGSVVHADSYDAPDENWHGHGGNAVDGDLATDWTDGWAPDYNSGPERQTVRIDFIFTSPTQISGYRWYASSNQSKNHDPSAWMLLASVDDGATWVMLDRVVEFSQEPARGGVAYTKTSGAKTGYKYYKFHPTSTRNSHGNDMDIADVSLYSAEGNRFLSGTDFTLTYDSTKFYWDGMYNWHYEPANAVDSNSDGSPKLDTRWDDYRFYYHIRQVEGGDYCTDLARATVWIRFNFNEPTVISAYSWSTSAKETDWDPTGWTLEASNDGDNWTMLDSKENYATTAERQVEAYRKSFAASVFPTISPEPVIISAGEVEVAEGKTLTVAEGVGLSASGAFAALTKTGAGELAIGAGAGATLNLQAGSVKVLSSVLNPFSTLGSHVIGGKLDLGGAEQWVAPDDDKGRHTFKSGAEIVNGKFVFATKYFMPLNDFTVGYNGNLILPEHAEISRLRIGERAAENGSGMVKITLDQGRFEDNSSDSGKVASIGVEQSDAVIEVKDGGTLRIPNQATALGRKGKSGTIYGNGGHVELGDQALYLGGCDVADITETASAGASGYVAITNGEFTAGSVVGGGYQFNSGVDSIGDVEFIGGWIDVYNFEARYNTRYQVRLGGGVWVYARTATNDFFGVSASYGGDTLATPPYVLLDGGIKFTHYYDIAELGIKTTLTGVGGITLENRVATTIYVDQAYTGDTVVKSRSMLAFEPGVTLAGKIVLEANTDAEHPEYPAGALLPPDLNGRKNVRYVWATSYEGVDTKVVDENYNHFFVDRDGWLCYGRPSGMSVTVR